MRTNDILIKITIFLFAISGFCSCMDDDSLSTARHFKENQFILKLPEKRVVDIKTRSTDDNNSIQNILVAVIRDGKAVFEYVSSDITLDNNGIIKCTLKMLAPKTGETVYFFCNVGDKSNISVSTSNELLASITCSSGADDVMYGVTRTNTEPVNLTHSMSNVEVTLGTDISGYTYTIDSLLVCDVPIEGFASGEKYTTSVVNDVPFKLPNTSMFVVPRPDNNVSGVTPTFLLIHLATKGWYKLDFYKNENNIAPGTSPQLLSISSNVFYKFEISSVKNDGYTTAEEARNNVSSNIIYDLLVDKNVSSSNGQYMLLADKEEILLYPNKPGGGINISAVIPEGEIVTYMAKVYGRNIKILDSENNPVDSLDLINGVLTTHNSQRTIEFSPLGTWLQDDYLEITLGNIKKKIPFKFYTANSYLFDCSKNESIKIPYLQANLDKDFGGKVRIDSNDNVVCELLWADQPGAGFDISDNKDAGWFEVKPTSNFSGNAIIAAKVNGEIRWSWHLWCINNSDNTIKYDDKKGLYDYTDEKVQHYCSNEWMDRNLGAFDLNDLAGPGYRGLGYQWGRKDPFNLGGQFPAYLDYNDKEPEYWPEGILYTPSGNFTLFDVKSGQSNCYPGDTIPSFYNVGGMDGKDALELSIQHPYVQTYLVGATGTQVFDWRYGIRSDSWNASDGKKTPYDPCPIGWRVPSGTEDPNGPLYELSIDNKVGETEYATKWHDDNGNDIYYPFVLYRYQSLVSPAKKFLNDLKVTRAYNRCINFPWGTFLTTKNTGGMTELFNFTDLGGSWGLPSKTAHISTVYSVYGLPVRCVRDKSEKY